MARPADYAFRQPAAGDAAHDPADVAAPTDSLAPVDPNSGDARDHERTVFPCSVAQERFWLLDRLDPGNASYNVAVRWRLEGRVDTELLERTWLLIIERHEILRTVFEEANGVAVQRVCPTCAFKLAEIDLQALPPDEQGAEGDRIGGLEARAPFDLGSGPILRATLLRFSPTVSIILVTTHQIVSDGWSIGVMAREMGIIYEALSHERPVPLEELAIQYADYSLWQLEWLRVRGTDAETAYWTRQLAGVKPFKVVPDRPRPALPTTRGVIVSRVLPRTVTDRAQAFSADRGATLFASVLATLCAVLARFTGEREILLGTQVSDRDQVELEPMVGQFVNSLILRNDVSDDPRFCDLVDRVGETTSQALEHRHIPIERLLGMVKGEHSHANSAPISVNFIFQKTFIRNTSYSDFTLIDMPSLPAGAIYDLNMFMVERPDGWRFSCQYNTDQFERDTAERLLRYVEQAMHSAMARPECRVSELQLSDPREAEDLLRQLHGARVPLPAMSVPESFAMQVMNRTDAIAVVHGSRTLRYVELDAAASRLAARLRELGLPRGATVGLSLENGIAWPVALLGILKAGFVAALIDSGTAAALRSAQIAASGCAAIVVADGAEIGAEIPRVDPVPLLEPASPRMTFDAPQVGTDQPACRLPVSGSNATQYVSLSHGNLVHLAFSLARRLQLGERDVFFGGMVQAPDRTIAETLAALLGGARIVIAEARQRGDWAHLADSLRRSEATVMYAEAPTWAGLLDAGWTPTAGFRMLHDLTQFGAPLADRLAATNGELWGLYGLTRAGIWSTAGRRRPREAARSIGTPLDHVQLQVIDSSGQQAVVGATGVLRIDSEGLPGCTTTEPARLKCTGSIELLEPNIASMVQQGWRIAAAEVDALLLVDARVKSAALVQMPSPQGDGALLACVVAKDPGIGKLDAELSARLNSALPAGAQPAGIRVLAELPCSPDGRVDRLQLASLLAGNTAGGDSAAEPSGRIEEELAQIWAGMLGLPKVPANENFFELGGHSLLAARMLAQVERAFGRRIKLVSLFTAPTVRGLARIIATPDLREFDFRQMVKIQPHGSKPPLIGINNTGIYYGLAKRLGTDQPVISLQLFDPSVKNERMPDTLEEIAAGYVQLIRAAQPRGPYSLMGWCVAGALAFEIACQLEAAGESVSHLYLMDSWVPRYLMRLAQPRRIINDFSLRWQFIWADWRRVFLGKQSLRDFLNNRIIVKKMNEYVTERSRGDAPADAGAGEYRSIEDYDQWLLRYLQRVTAKYEPKRFGGRITLFRSRLEPTGWLFDQYAGWGAFAAGGVELHMLDGNHFTMFQDPGAAQMATLISAGQQQIATQAHPGGR